MTSLTPPLEYWFMALREQVGIILMTNDASRMRQALYIARSEVKDLHPELMSLSICISPSAENELWIIHKTVRINVDDSEGPGPTPETHT